MNKTAFPTATLPTTAILSIMLHLTMVLTKRAMRKTIRAIRFTHEWLNTKHEFCGEDGDPIKWTGWQYLGFGVITCIVGFALCIKC